MASHSISILCVALHLPPLDGSRRIVERAGLALNPFPILLDNPRAHIRLEESTIGDAQHKLPPCVSTWSQVQ